METILLVISILLGLSLALSGFLGFKLYYFKKNQKESYDTRQLMHDLTSSGQAIVEIRRIDPTQVFIRSPR